MSHHAELCAVLLFVLPCSRLSTGHQRLCPACCAQLLLNLTYTDGASVDSFAILLPGFFVALLILGVDEVARWVLPGGS